MSDLKRINQELGITIVVNLHSVQLAREYGTRIIGLRDGCLVLMDQLAKPLTEN